MECLQTRVLMTIFAVGFLTKTTQALETNTGHITETEGSKVTLNCRPTTEGRLGTLIWSFGSSDSQPIMSVYSSGAVAISVTNAWKDDIEVAQDGTSLVISTLKLQRDDGTFYCSLLANDVSIVVEVLVPVTTDTITRADNSPLSTLSTSPASFTCTVTSRPEASVTWELMTSEGSTTTLTPIEPSTSTLDGKLFKVASTLLYTPMREHDGGHIVCQGKNTVTSGSKTSSTTTNLSIHYPPILEPEQTEVQSQSVVEKSELLLKCTSWANPQTEFTWKHATQAISAGIVNTDKTNNRRESTLTISDTKMADAGLYSCSARNDLGNVTSPGFNVTVQMWIATADTDTKTVAIAVGVAVPLVLIIAAIVAFVIIRTRRKKHAKSNKVPETVYANNFTEMTRQNNINTTLDPGVSYDKVIIGGGGGGGTVSMEQDNTRDGSPGIKHKVSVHGQITNGTENRSPQCAVIYATTENVSQNLIAQNKVPVNTAGLVYADLSHGVDLTKFPPPKPMRLGEQRGTEYAAIDISRTDKSTYT